MSWQRYALSECCCFFRPRVLNLSHTFVTLAVLFCEFLYPGEILVKNCKENHQELTEGKKKNHAF